MRQKLVILPKLNDCGGDLSKQWFIYFSCRNPKTGKMQRFRHYDGFTGLQAPAREAHAHEIIESLSTRLRSGWTPFTDDTAAIYNDHIDYKTVAEMYGSRRVGNDRIRIRISQFLEEIQPGIRHATYLTYKSKLRIFCLWLEREKAAENDISTIDNKVIISFFRYLIADRKLSRVSIKYYTELLKKTFEHFKKAKMILYNPVYDIPPCNRINDQAPRPIQRADIKAFKKEIRKDPELWLAVQFEYYCALRPGHELREMKIQDIDFIAGTIHVNRQRAKNTHSRVVTIPRQFLQQLRTSYNLQKCDRNYFVFGRGGIPGPYSIGKNKLNYRFVKIRTRLHMPSEYKFYSWKHTGAVEVDQEKIPHKDISNHLGHSSMSMTDEYFKNKKAGVSTAIRDNYPTL